MRPIPSGSVRPSGGCAVGPSCIQSSSRHSPPRAGRIGRCSCASPTLGVTPLLPEQTRAFFGRPFQVIALHGFAEALWERIQDPEVRALAEETLIGSIDQISDNVDLVTNGRFRFALRNLYEIEA